MTRAPHIKGDQSGESLISAIFGAALILVGILAGIKLCSDYTLVVREAQIRMAIADMQLMLGRSISCQRTLGAPGPVGSCMPGPNEIEVKSHYASDSSLIPATAGAGTLFTNGPRYNFKIRATCSMDGVNAARLLVEFQLLSKSGEGVRSMLPDPSNPLQQKNLGDWQPLFPGGALGGFNCPVRPLDMGGLWVPMATVAPFANGSMSCSARCSLIGKVSTPDLQGAICSSVASGSSSSHSVGFWSDSLDSDYATVEYFGGTKFHCRGINGPTVPDPAPPIPAVETDGCHCL